jgi:hypothetical protein
MRGYTVHCGSTQSQISGSQPQRGKFTGRALTAGAISLGCGGAFCGGAGFAGAGGGRGGSTA